MRTWIRSAAYLTPSEILEVCRNDLAREKELIRLSMSTKRTSIDSEKYTHSLLFDFQESFAEALRMLLSTFPSMPDLSQFAKVSSHVLDMHTTGASAHLIVFNVDLSDLRGSNMLTEICVRGSGADDHRAVVSPIVSSSFVYTPQTLFDAAQSMVSHRSLKCREQFIEEFNRFYPTIPHIQPPDDCHIFSSDIGLVSTFSFDSDSDADRRRSLRNKLSFSSLKSWASSSAHNRRGRTRTPAPPMPNMHTIPEARNAEYHPLASTSRPSESSRPGLGQPQYGDNRHPYLHVRLPPPLVFPYHPYSTNRSNTSLDSQDEVYNAGDTIVFTDTYHLANHMERADAWRNRF